MVSEIQAATTNAGTRAQGGLTPDLLTLSIVEAEPHFRDWCMDTVRASTELRDEQRQIVQFAVVPDLDMAGARGSALAALQMLRIAAA